MSPQPIVHNSIGYEKNAGSQVNNTQSNAQMNQFSTFKNYNLEKVWNLSLLGSITKMWATSRRQPGEDLAFHVEKP